MGKYIKRKKNLNLVVLKQENHNLSRETAKINEFKFSSTKEKHSFIADTNLQVN